MGAFYFFWFFFHSILAWKRLMRVYSGIKIILRVQNKMTAGWLCMWNIKALCRRVGEILFRLNTVTLMKKIFSPGSFQQSSLVTLHGKKKTALNFHGGVKLWLCITMCLQMPLLLNMLFLWCWLETGTFQQAKALALMANNSILK